MDFMAEPEIGHAICQCIAELRIEQARRLAALGIDILRLGDDVCTQKGLLMGLGTYRTFLKERTRAIIRAAKEVNPDLLVFMHCDGRVEDMIEEYIDIGIDILNPVQPECNDMAEIVRRSGGRLSYWGGIGTQSTMPFGSPGDVASAVAGRRRCSAAKAGCWWPPPISSSPRFPGATFWPSSRRPKTHTTS